MKRADLDRREGEEAVGMGASGPSLLRRAEMLRRPAQFGKSGRLACLLAASVLLQCTRPVEVGQKAPDFVLEDLKGGSVSLGELRGKVGFLHFWATWCPPCLVELPGLLRFVEGLDKGKYVLLAVCVDSQPPSMIGDFVRSWGAEIPVYLDPGGSLAGRFGTFRFPETYVLDHQGGVCRKVIGAGDWEKSKWAHILHTCAGETDTGRTGTDADS